MRQITFEDVLTTSTARSGKLGQKAQTPDGREWVYVKASQSLVTGHLAINSLVVGVDTVSSSTNNAGQIVYITEASAGWTVDQFADCWLVVDDGTGEGQWSKIKSNTSDTLELYPEYRLTTALAVADSDITIVHNGIVDRALITATAQDCVGVAQVAFAAGEYGWLLKHGIGHVLSGAVATAGQLLVPGDDTAGEVTTMGNNGTTSTVVGYVVGINSTVDEDLLAQITL